MLKRSDKTKPKKEKGLETVNLVEEGDFDEDTHTDQNIEDHNIVSCDSCHADSQKNDLTQKDLFTGAKQAEEIMYVQYVPRPRRNNKLNSTDNIDCINNEVIVEYKNSTTTVDSDQQQKKTSEKGIAGKLTLLELSKQCKDVQNVLNDYFS